MEAAMAVVMVVAAMVMMEAVTTVVVMVGAMADLWEVAMEVVTVLASQTQCCTQNRAQ